MFGEIVDLTLYQKKLDVPVKYWTFGNPDHLLVVLFLLTVCLIM